MTAVADYRVWLECDGRIINPHRPLPMVYVAHPPDQILLGTDPRVLYQIRRLTWTPDTRGHYILHLEALEADPGWAPASDAAGARR